MLFIKNCVSILLILLIPEILSANILGLFTSTHRSHMLVYQGVIRGLLKRGHNITIVTILPIDDKEIISKNVTLITLRKPQKAVPAHGIFRQIAVIEANGKVFDDPYLQTFLANNNTFDLVILGYLFNDYQLGLAAHFNCPTVVIWTTQATSFVKRFIGEPNQWMDVPQPYVRSQAVGVRGLMYGAFETVFRWIVDFLMNKLYQKYFSASNYPSLTDLQNNVSLVLCNHHFSEGPFEAHLPNLIEISGIQIKDTDLLPKALQEFMDSADHGVIYFSLGTVVSAKQLGPSILNIFHEVFSSIPQKVIWKINNPVKNSSNIFTSKWLPQSSILAHPKTRLFITHGGKGSRIEALNFGVPMIAIPFFGDQFAGARRLVKKGLGLQLDSKNINESILRQSIFGVLYNNTYSSNIKEASQIFKDRPLTAEQTATYWIEYVIRHKGALHMRSPSKQLNLLQYHNIDVYLLCVCFVFIVNISLRIVHMCSVNVYRRVSIILRKINNVLVS
ncbi:UDP-glucosyltransferase 2-like [Episyrphus balteatus]|uniref:UDP-glucosyltransferase 2-like n=1 Tax=Episyrphus balteatus TaxID=286459 RepID=UPI0024854E46|nr:UDP-glucosyltransferase 2-like [Episyrphus balteatus]